jgi:hypothetical protein
MVRERDKEQFLLTKTTIILSLIAIVLHTADLVFTYVFLTEYPNIIHETGPLASCVLETQGLCVMFLLLYALKVGIPVLFLYTIFPVFVKNLTMCIWIIPGTYAVVTQIQIAFQLL